MFHAKTQTTDYQRITLLTRSVILHLKNGTRRFKKKEAPAFFHFFLGIKKLRQPICYNGFWPQTRLRIICETKKGQQPAPGATPFLYKQTI